MPNVDDFFFHKNTVKNITNIESEQVFNYLESIKAFARTTYKSIYVIDYQKKGFEYVSDNPLFLCGYTANEVKEMGYEFYFKHVIKKDLDLLLKINSVGFDFYDKLPLKERKQHTISYDFHLQNQEGRIILINQKLTPIFLTKNGKIWKGLCIVSLSSENNSGNIKITKKGSNTIFEYNLKDDCWIISKKIQLTDREKEILQFSIRGYTINEIANEIHLSTDTIKFHRKRIFEKTEVSNISEAISYIVNNKLI